MNTAVFEVKNKHIFSYHSMNIYVGKKTFILMNI